MVVSPAPKSKRKKRYERLLTCAQVNNKMRKQLTRSVSIVTKRNRNVREYNSTENKSNRTKAKSTKIKELLLKEA